MEAPKRKVICQRVKNKLKKLNPGKRHKGNSKKSNMYDTSIGESSIPPPLPMSDISEGIPQDNEAPSTGDSVSEKIVGLPDWQEIEGASASEEVEDVFPTTVGQ